MPCKISPRSTAIIPIKLEIPPLLGDHFSLSISLLLILFDLLILVNMIYKLTHTPNKLPCQRLSQIILGGQVDLESPYGHIIKIPVDLIKHILVFVRVCFKGLPLSHGHRQQRVQGPQNSIASNKMSLKCLNKLFKGINRAFT